MTPQCEEEVAADRLRSIGRHLESLSACGALPLRVLVIDDFFLTPLSGWLCDDVEVSKAEDAEAYLRNCAPSADLRVKLVHTYASWETAAGLGVQVGCGITMAHLRQAEDFLEAELEPVKVALDPVPSKSRSRWHPRLP